MATPSLLASLAWSCRFGGIHCSRGLAAATTFEIASPKEDVPLTAIAADSPNGSHAGFEPDTVIVLGLRGSAGLPDPEKTLRGIEASVERLAEDHRRIDRTGSPIPPLILGVDPVLDTWAWLKMDREKKRIARSSVY